MLLAERTRRLKSANAQHLLALLFMLCIGQPMALACSCWVGSPCWDMSTPDLSFVGKPIAVRRAGDGAVAVDFAVTEAFGKLTGNRTLTVYTKSQSTACGYPFAPGVEYFVSANSVESKLWTSSCGSTRPAKVAAGLIRQMRALQAGQPPARIFGFIGVEPYPGGSPGSRLEAKPTASVVVTAVGRMGQFRTVTAADGSDEFIRLPDSVYQLRVQLPKDLFIWWASDQLKREYHVSGGKICEADFPLYPKDDLFAANQPR